MLGTISFFVVAFWFFSFAEAMAMIDFEDDDKQMAAIVAFGIIFAVMATYILIELGVLEWAVK